MHSDFSELLSTLNAHRVKYLVVGAYAVSIYAQPRATKDLDILVKADAENAKAVFEALAQFGAPLNVSGLRASFISRDDLIAAKLAAARPQDLADVDVIR